MIKIINYIFFQFELACEEVKSFADKLSNDVKLSLYGNFKQATVGDNNTGKLSVNILYFLYLVNSIDKPGFLDLKGKSKWEAWNKLKGTS